MLVSAGWNIEAQLEPEYTAALVPSLATDLSSHDFRELFRDRQP